MKKVIVKGDDFGLLPDTNRGIIEAHPKENFEIIVCMMALRREKNFS